MATIKFENDSIIIFKGNTYPHLSWFRNSGATYNPLFGWFFQKMEDLPVDYPDELEPLVLPVADITNSAGVLKTDQEIKEVVESLLYPASLLATLKSALKYMSQLSEQSLLPTMVLLLHCILW